MAIFYSSSVGGFYDSGIHATMPDDVVEISAAEHAALLDAQRVGCVISADEAGRPIAVPKPEPTDAERWVAVRAQRGGLLAASDWTQLADSPLSEVDREAWAVVRQAWRDITLQQNPADLSWPVPPT